MAKEIPLGKKTTTYPDLVDSKCLFPIAREQYRKDIPSVNCAIYGYDLWNSYEFSWLDAKTGWPVQGHLQLSFDQSTTHIIESKSLKLYLGSYANTLLSEQEVLIRLKSDIEPLINGKVVVSFEGVSEPKPILKRPSLYQDLLTTPTISKDFNLFFEGFKSMCPVTSSPDFATIYLSGRSAKEQSVDILKDYLFSYALRQEFHEHCIESIFSDLISIMSLSSLIVIGSFTRRGSLDINPIRSTSPFDKRWHRELLN